MEAPEKLYFNTSDIYGVLGIYSKKEPGDSIEYIRKDSFIGKALKWMTMKECIDDLLSVEMINEFKTYMEEE